MLDLVEISKCSSFDYDAMLGNEPFHNIFRSIATLLESLHVSSLSAIMFNHDFSCVSLSFYWQKYLAKSRLLFWRGCRGYGMCIQLKLHGCLQFSVDTGSSLLWLVVLYVSVMPKRSDIHCQSMWNLSFWEYWLELTEAGIYLMVSLNILFIASFCYMIYVQALILLQWISMFGGIYSCMQK